LQLHLESISSWSTSGADKTNLSNDKKHKSDAIKTIPAWPKLEFVPAMQRRRLSPFAKIALYTAENALSDLARSLEPLAVPEQVEIIFSSRHGDLHKTAELLTELSADQDISPTAFSTSVHNAVPGLYSILKQNKQAINAVSAGQDSFFYALVDAYARLKSGRAQRLLVVHVDRELPELYAEFLDEQQIDHAVAMVVTLEPTPATIANFNVSFNAVTGAEISVEQARQQHNQQATAELNYPAALCFIDWFDRKSSTALQYTSQRHVWTCARVAGTMDV